MTFRGDEKEGKLADSVMSRCVVTSKIALTSPKISAERDKRHRKQESLTLKIEERIRENCCPQRDVDSSKLDEARYGDRYEQDAVDHRIP